MLCFALGLNINNGKKKTTTLNVGLVTGSNSYKLQKTKYTQTGMMKSQFFFKAKTTKTKNAMKKRELHR